MKINTTVPLVGLDGKPIKFGPDEMTLGIALSSMLLGVEQKSIPAMKSYILSTKLYSEKEVEVDEADFNLLKTMVEADKTFSPLITGQSLQILNKLKPEEDAKKEK